MVFSADIPGSHETPTSGRPSYSTVIMIDRITHRTLWLFTGVSVRWRRKCWDSGIPAILLRWFVHHPRWKVYQYSVVHLNINSDDFCGSFRFLLYGRCIPYFYLLLPLSLLIIWSVLYFFHAGHLISLAFGLDISVVSFLFLIDSQQLNISNTIEQNSEEIVHIYLNT